MKFLTYTDGIELDVNDLIMDIDMIFHEKISDKTGAIIPHCVIQHFVMKIIKENNKEVLALRAAEKKITTGIKQREKEYHEKIASGKTVKNLNTFLNKFKHYYLGYLLYDPDLQSDE